MQRLDPATWVLGGRDGSDSNSRTVSLLAARTWVATQAVLNTHDPRGRTPPRPPGSFYYSGSHSEASPEPAPPALPEVLFKYWIVSIKSTPA